MYIEEYKIDGSFDYWLIHYICFTNNMEYEVRYTEKEEAQKEFNKIKENIKKKIKNVKYEDAENLISNDYKLELIFIKKV